MPTSAEIRWANARELARQAGGPAQFARTMGMSDSQAAQIVGPRPTRNIGSAVARRIEEKFGKPKGWLDQDHNGEDAAGGSLDEQVLLLYFRKLADAQQQQAVAFARKLYKRQAENPHNLREGRYIPDPEADRESDRAFDIEDGKDVQGVPKEVDVYGPVREIHRDGGVGEGKKKGKRDGRATSPNRGRSKPAPRKVR